MPERSEIGRKVISRISDGFMSIDRDWRITYINDEAARLLSKPGNEVIGKNILDIFAGARGTSFERKYKQALESQETVYFEKYYPPMDSWFSVSAYPSESGLSIYFKDVTARKEDARRLQNGLEHQKEMRDLLRMVIEGEDFVEVLHEASRIVVEGLCNDYGAILQVDEDGSGLVLSAHHGVDTVNIGEQVMQMEDSEYLGELFGHKGPIYTANIEQDDAEDMPPKLRSLGVRSLAGALIGKFGEPWGVLISATRRNRTFREEEEKFVQNVANILATALNQDNDSADPGEETTLKEH